mmetsp:Transcript_4590/g.18342  ORF Transcript_4590/g.18342 Transcript_4590/m.18342 type:complete len:226 (-) Transcript_4590:710-1387(-)
MRRAALRRLRRLRGRPSLSFSISRTCPSFRAPTSRSRTDRPLIRATRARRRRARTPRTPAGASSRTRLRSSPGTRTRLKRPPARGRTPCRNTSPPFFRPLSPPRLRTPESSETPPPTPPAPSRGSTAARRPPRRAPPKRALANQARRRAGTGRNADASCARPGPWPSRASPGNWHAWGTRRVRASRKAATRRTRGGRGREARGRTSGLRFLGRRDRTARYADGLR